MDEKRAHLGLLLLVILIFSLASFFGVNQYIYGHWNHYNTIPFLKNLIDSSLYPGDPLVAQRAYFFTYLFPFLKSLLPISWGSIPHLFAMLYLPSIFFTFFGVYMLAFQLFQKRSIAIVSLTLFAFTFPTIGYVQSWESLFYERTLTLPLLIFSLYFFLKDKLIIGSTLHGLAFLIHPLSAVYVIGISWLSQIFRAKSFELKNFIPLLWLLILISPVLYLKMTQGTGEGMFKCDAEWLEIMRLRNFHHAFPFTFDWDLFAKSAIVLAAFVFFVKSLDMPASLKRWLWGFCTAVVLFLIIGTLFTEIFPLKIIIQFQFFRSFRFLIYLVILLWSAAIVFMPLKKVLLVSPFMLLIYFDGQLSKFVAVLALFALVLFLFRIFKMEYAKSKFIIVAAYVLIGIAAFVMRGDFTIQNQQNTEWLEVQEWAQQNTDSNSLFIVPPKEWGFRLESERSIYADWDDGTKAFFNTAYAKEWMRRMHMLNTPNPDKLVADYKENSLLDFEKIRQEQKALNIYSSYFVIAYHEMDLPAKLCFSNKSFKVYEL